MKQAIGRPDFDFKEAYKIISELLRDYQVKAVDAANGFNKIITLKIDSEKLAYFDFPKAKGLGPLSVGPALASRGVLRQKDKTCPCLETMSMKTGEPIQIFSYLLGNFLYDNGQSVFQIQLDHETNELSIMLNLRNPLVKLGNKQEMMDDLISFLERIKAGEPYVEARFKRGKTIS